MTRRGAPGPQEGRKATRRKAGEATPSNTTNSAAEAAPRRARAAKPAEPPVAPPQAEDSLQFAPVRSARRARTGMIVAAGIVIACGASAAIGLGKAMDGRSHAGMKPASAAARIGNQVEMATALPSDTPAEATELADYTPPDRDQVRRAYDDVGKVYGTEGLSGVVRLGMDCYVNLEARPSYAQLDYCLAYDAYGAALQRHVTGGQALPAESWFAASGPRGIKAAQKVVGRDGDPSARLFDVQRLAGEVSHEDPRGAEAEVTIAQAAPPPSAQVDEEGAPAATPTALAAAPATLVRASTPVRAEAPALRPALKAAPVKAQAEKAAPAKLTKAKAAAKPTPAKPVVKASVKTKPAAKLKPAKPLKIAKASPSKKAKLERASFKASKPSKSALKPAKARAKKPGLFARLERAAVRSRDAVFKPKPKPKPVKASAPAKSKAKPVKKRERAAPPKKARLTQASTPVRRKADARLQKASTAKRAQRYRDGLPVVDCRRPIGRSEKEVCQAVRVADRRALNYPPYEADGDGTLGGQYERWRGRGGGN